MLGVHSAQRHCCIGQSYDWHLVNGINHGCVPSFADVPWGVQLAAAYALFELGPSNPSGVLEAIRVWEAASTNSLPLAVTSGMAEVSSLLNKQREQYKVPENQTGLPGEKAT